MNTRGVRLSLVLGVLAFALDRGQKALMLDVYGWRGGEVIHVAPFFDYRLVWNPGISYGLLTFLPPVALLGIAIAAMVALVWWWVKAEGALVRAGLALALGGALSNALDRWLYGAVADFFHFHLGAWSFYIFNIADTAISLGVVLLVLDLALPRRIKPV
ncbi:MAG TPA: signal peptidase II [Devosiaceae bacterium]